MYKNRKFKVILLILLFIMGIMTFKLIFILDKINKIKGQSTSCSTVAANIVEIEKYGYSDILDLIRKNSDFEVKTLNMIEQEKCNIQVDYTGDIKLLYISLCSLNESKNLLKINSININKEAKATTVSIDFKKNK